MMRSAHLVSSVSSAHMASPFLAARGQAGVVTGTIAMILVVSVCPLCVCMCESTCTQCTVDCCRVLCILIHSLLVTHMHNGPHQPTASITATYIAPQILSNATTTITSTTSISTSNTTSTAGTGQITSYQCIRLCAVVTKGRKHIISHPQTGSINHYHAHSPADVIWSERSQSEETESLYG